MALGAFGIITTEFGVIGLLPAISADLHISIETAGWLLSGFALTIALTGPFAVLATSAVNKKTLMCLSILMFLISNVISAFAPDFSVLLIARIIPAVLHPVFWSVATVAAAREVTPEQAPRAVAVIMGGLSLATVLGVPITSYVADLAGWRYSFFFAGAVNLLAFVCLAYFIPSMPVKNRTSMQGQLKALNKGQLWMNLFSTMLMIGGMFASYSYLAEFLDKVTHMSGSQISAMFLVFGAAGIGGNWLAGRLLTRNILFTTRLFLLSLSAIYLAAFYLSSYFYIMMFILAVWGFIHTGGFLIGQVITTKEAPDAPELATSLLASFANAGVTLGTAIGGFTITHFSVHYLPLASMLLLGITFLFSFIRIPSVITFSRPVLDPEPEAESCLRAAQKCQGTI